VSTGDAYNFDRQSVERIGRAVRRVEQMPFTDTPPRMGNAPLIPFQIQRFRLVGSWSYDDSGQYATAYRLYWTGSAWVEDTSTTHTIRSGIVELWDFLLNTDSTPSNDYRETVIAYHRHDRDYWQVIHANQNNRRWVKCADDWQVPDGSHAFPWVSAQLYDNEGDTTYSDAFDVTIPIAWDATYLTSPAPLLWEDDICAIDVDRLGWKTVASPLGFSYLGETIEYTLSSTNIPTGYVLCDGSALPADKKVSASNAPDDRGRVVMGIDPSNDAGDSSESSIGATPGKRTSPNHQHNIRMAGIAQEMVDTGTGWNTWDIASTADPETSGVEATDENPTATDHLDRRQKSIVRVKLYRYK